MPDFPKLEARKFGDTKSWSIYAEGGNRSLASVRDADLARLMAAAPDLLAACRQALEWATGAGDYDDGNDTIASLAEDVVPLLDEAIAKATGQPSS